MTITPDLIKSQSLSINDKGYSSERSFIINNVTGDVAAKLYNSMNSAGIPQFGDPHPVVPNIFVSSVRALPIKNGTQISISVTYSPPDIKEDSVADDGSEISGSISVKSSTISDRTYKDINGNFMTVTWHTGASLIKATRQAEVQRPQMSVSLSRIEDIFPKQALIDFVGTINSQGWSGFPPKTWLCTGINVTQGKDGFNVDYDFSYNKLEWRFVATTLLDGVVPAGATEGNGFTTFEVYEAKNFNELGVSF